MRIEIRPILTHVIRRVLRDLPHDHAFGLMSNKNEWNARDCISGDYTEEETKAPKELGKSVPVKGARIADINTSVPAGLSHFKPVCPSYSATSDLPGIIF